MASSFTLNLRPLHQTQLQLSSFSHCKYSSTLNTFEFYSSSLALSLSPTKPTITLEANARAAATEHLCNENEVRTSLISDFRSGFSSFSDASERAVESSPERKRVILKDRHAKRGSNLNSVRSKNVVRNSEKIRTLKGVNEECGNHGVGMEGKEKRIKKAKVDPGGLAVRVGLDMCSKRGNVFGAIKLYDLARQEGVKIGQYHYAVLLYLCSSAATGVVHPAKSGNSNRSLSEMAKNEPLIEHTEKIELDMDGVSEDLSDSLKGSMDGFPQTLDGLVQAMKRADERSNSRDDGNKGYGIKVSKEMKRVALRKGFEIYNKMRLEKVPMNEATFTSVARMAMALGDGDMAFDVVKQMKEHGVSPRLRSYGPALAIFCGNGDVENAFMVEQHMLENGVYPEETELNALLGVSIETGKSDKVYYVLHKLRTSVRQVSPTTADMIEKWFTSKTASGVGKRKWDRELIIQAMENGGGGWHGKGWLGKGKWTICRTSVGSNGVCKSCGEKLVTIDLDPVETENFAKSVASIAVEREKNSGFQKFQKWLDYYGPFETVVDAANIGLYSQRKFKPSKVNAVVNGIRQMLPSKKWPLIVLHNRRISGEKMDEPFNRAIIEKWKNADALYATPTGSNDDWYWLYAAIKFKCLIVTNDEMRDHLFQLLGNDIFPKWKERHQVHFSFTETGPMFRMPPPCSVVIQESEEGQWHVPIASEVRNEDERTWLCCSRANSTSSSNQDSSDELKEGAKVTHRKKRETRKHVEPTLVRQDRNREVEELRSNAKGELKSHASILPHIEAAEKSGAFLIDFQI